MNNIKLLTGGLVLIVLGLAGGTGYLIYDRIQNEVAPAEKATKQDIINLQQEQAETKQDVTQLKDSDRVQSAKIEVLEEDVVTLQLKADQQGKLIKKLEENDAATAEELAAAKTEREGILEKLKGQKEELDKAKAERKEIRDQLAAQGERIDEQEKKIDDLAKKGDARDQELAALRAELAELKRQLGLGDPDPSN